MDGNPINSSLGASPRLDGLSDNLTNTSASDKALSSDFETFLRMLTVQLQNQDPLNPVEASDYAVQLATFSGVEQQVKTNDLLGGLGEQFQVLGLSQYANWVGMEARHAGPVTFDGTPVEVLFDVPADADYAELIVNDLSGTEISRTILATPTGRISWDGLAADGSPLPVGSYALSVESYLQGQSIGTSAVQSYSVVQQARFESGEALLTLTNGDEIKPDEVFGLRAANGGNTP